MENCLVRSLIEYFTCKRGRNIEAGLHVLLAELENCGVALAAYRQAEALVLAKTLEARSRGQNCHLPLLDSQERQGGGRKPRICLKAIHDGPTRKDWRSEWGFYHSNEDLVGDCWVMLENPPPPGGPQRMARRGLGSSLGCLGLGLRLVSRSQIKSWRRQHVNERGQALDSGCIWGGGGLFCCRGSCSNHSVGISSLCLRILARSGK